MWKTWANLLTGIRLLALVPSMWAIGSGRWLLAGALFTLAVVTDLADGPVARRLDHATPGGGLFDHATDALFVAGNLAALAWTGVVNAWLPPLVLLAFAQYMLDSRALAGATLRTSRLGRYNGIAYFVMVGIPVIGNALRLDWPPEGMIRLLAWLLVATTLISITDRAVALLRTRRSGTPAP